jgi:hypothetical protein
MILLHAGARLILSWTNTLFSFEFYLYMVNEAEAAMKPTRDIGCWKVEVLLCLSSGALKRGFDELKIG